MFNLGNWKREAKLNPRLNIKTFAENANKFFLMGD